MSMYPKDVERIHREWGDRECDHPSFNKERDERGTSTGDYVCTQCGRVFLAEEKQRIEASLGGGANEGKPA